MKRTMFRIGVKAAIALAVALGATSAQAAPYPTAPYSTVGGATPTRYCRSPIDGSTAALGDHSYQGINLEATGCLSGMGPAAYPDASNGLYKDTDGLYVSSYKDADVERSILLATGEVVDLQLYREAVGASSGSGIQIWLESGQRQITWAFEPWLVASIQAGTIAINYLTIKASDSYVLYEIPTGAFSGRYSTEGIMTKGGNQPQVSHVRFWKEIDYVTVAEPGPVALFGLGFLALGLRRRRR